MKDAAEATYLFTLRLWQESMAGDQAEWRGKLQSLPSGEVHYFRDWEMLVSRLQAMLAGQSTGDAQLVTRTE